MQYCVYTDAYMLSYFNKNHKSHTSTFKLILSEISSALFHLKYSMKAASALWRPFKDGLVLNNDGYSAAPDWES